MKKSNEFKTVIFSTTDIQRFGSSNDDCKSTGLLEKAIEEGFIVYIVTARSIMGTYDCWWQKLVRPERVYITGNMNDNELLELWKKLYDIIGLGALQHFNRWDDVKSFIEENSCVLTGVTFRQRYIERNIMTF